MQTRRLIEEWLPMTEIGIESLRERIPMTPFPAPNRLHVWWARRPLVAARAAVLASLLPWDADREKFLHAIGIHGDPVAAKQRIEEATRKGVRLGADAYGYPRAFGYTPTQDEKDWIVNELKKIDLNADVTVLDPTAGGGSIPFEALRLGFNAFSNDLNPVAGLLEKLTFEIPAKNEVDVYCKFGALGEKFGAIVRDRLSDLFPPEDSENYRPDGYLFARTIRCPYCGGLIPLSPNWRLAPDGTGVRIVPHQSADPAERKCTFEIVSSLEEQSEGTVASGRATCPFPDCGRVIGGDDVKKIAQSGGMGEQLYAVVYKEKVQTSRKDGSAGRVKWVRGYRAPRPEDDVFDAIKAKLEEKLPEWEALDMVPTEFIPDGLKTIEPIRYGMTSWRDLFSPRQLYCHCTSVQVYRELLEEYRKNGKLGDVEKAAFAYLALSLDKLLNYNSRMSVWMSTREVMANTFNRHDFAFCWSFAEMASLIVGLGYDWAIEQTGKSLGELICLLNPAIKPSDLKKQATKEDQGSLLDTAPAEQVRKASISVSCASADRLDHIADHSIDLVCMDPPYYDNVMYAELSDFFYVWLKRTAGYVYPELFLQELTDKENEAVANPAQFKGQKKPKDLAYDKYRERMASIFAECLRVLKDDGVLLLMFNHKATNAWDALTRGLIEAGFVITASWPVNTEAEGSLHIRDKAAANSTIFLVCRPREAQGDQNSLFWEDLEPLVRSEVLHKVEQFKASGISGIDLYLASFGPALEVFSRHWPVRRGTPRAKPVSRINTQGSLFDQEFDPFATSPDDVLQVARTAVKNWSLEQIL